MKITDFLDQFVDGYLLSDLESMANIELPKGQAYGAAGYPMVATTLTGMELLGRLLWPIERNIQEGCEDNTYFQHYWSKYLSAEKSEYKKFSDIARQLVRNGINHLFIAKPGVVIYKGDPNQHFAIDHGQRLIYINCVTLYHDFKASYLSKVKPMLSDTTPRSVNLAQNMQAQLDQIIELYSQNSEEIFGNLKPPKKPTSHFDKVENFTDPRFTNLRLSTASTTITQLHMPVKSQDDFLRDIEGTATIPSNFATPSGIKIPQ